MCASARELLLQDRGKSGGNNSSHFMEDDAVRNTARQTPSTSLRLDAETTASFFPFLCVISLFFTRRPLLRFGGVCTGGVQRLHSHQVTVFTPHLLFCSLTSLTDLIA